MGNLILRATASALAGYSITRVAETNAWVIRDATGLELGTYEGDLLEDGYYSATEALGALLTEQLLAELAADDGSDSGDGTSPDGLLPERWTSDKGIAFSVVLDGGRDFTNCSWSWRDPTKVLVPLMLMTTTTEYGHLGAELAGFIEEFTLADGTVAASGRFYDNAAGIQFRDLLLGERRYGVSVDPTEKVDVDAHDECTEYDEDGFCVAGKWVVEFLAYEIGAVTGAPVAGFEDASVILAPAGSAAGGSSAAAQPVRASLSVPARPPRSWLTLTEPQIGESFLDGIGDDVLVDQLDQTGAAVAVACPLTIRDDGLVYGHLTWWGQCHVANPWGPGKCASAQPSMTAYREFMTGETELDDGSRLATGVFTVGCEHSSAFDVKGVRDHLAHAGLGWANVRIVDGVHGPWCVGVLRPDITEAQVRLLRSLSLSGEWVKDGLGGIVSVNVGGLPVQRSLAASAWPDRLLEVPRHVLRASRRGELEKLVGGNLVGRCTECEKRRALGATNDQSARRELARLLTRFDAHMAILAKLEERTRHLITVEADSRRDALTAAGRNTP